MNAKIIYKSELIFKGIPTISDSDNLKMVEIGDFNEAIGFVKNVEEAKEFYKLINK